MPQVQKMEPPPRRYGAGKPPRFSDGQIKQFAEKVSNREFAGDGIPVPVCPKDNELSDTSHNRARNCAYSRGTSVVSRLRKNHQLDAKVTVWQEDGKYKWAVGPR